MKKKMEDKKITEKESLEIITQMIQKTRRNVVDGNSFIYLGLLLVALSLIAGAFTLLTKNLWFAVINMSLLVVWNICAWLVIRKAIKRNGASLSYIDNMLKITWDTVCGIGFAIPLMIMIGLLFSLGSYLNLLAHYWAVPMIQSMLLIIGCLISGQLLGMKLAPMSGLLGATIPLVAFMVNFEVSPIFEFGCAMAVLTIVAAVTITAFGYFLKVNNLKQYERA
jgi:hypothetical protein